MGTPQDVQRNLQEMTRINRYLGGIRAVTRHLYPRLRAQSLPATVVDIGTGAADLPNHITQWAQKKPHNGGFLAPPRGVEPRFSD